MSDKRNDSQDEYEGFMSYLRGDGIEPSAGSGGKSSSGTDDLPDAFNVVDASEDFAQLLSRRSAENASRAAKIASEQDMKEYRPAHAAEDAPEHQAARPVSSGGRTASDAAKTIAADEMKYRSSRAASAARSASGTQKTASLGEKEKRQPAKTASSGSARKESEYRPARLSSPAVKAPEPAPSAPRSAAVSEPTRITPVAGKAPAPSEKHEDDEVRQYTPTRRPPRYTSEMYNASLPRKNVEEFTNSWKDIPEDKPARKAAAITAPPIEYEDDEEEDNFITRRKNRRKRTRFKLLKALAWLGAMLVISIVLSIFLIQSCGDVFGYDSGGEDTKFVITTADDYSSIADRLTKEGIISQKLTFKFYTKFKKATEGFTPGTYNLNPDMSYDEILAVTRQTLTEEKKVVKITFREGLTVYEIAELLAENGVCDRDEFLKTLETEDLGFDFIDAIPKDPLRFRKLEGYLFPDTYDFYVGENTVSVAKKFLNNFNNKITASMYTKMEEQGITLDQLVTLASIVQKEAGRAKEMNRVSSVFRNRLDSEGAFPLLQSDTTTNYINDSIVPFLTVSNQAMLDSYNTYVTSGLPSGPICCPGINALRAALDPADTPYYFFLSDEKGTYYYAKNFNEHQNNAAKAARVGEGEVHGIGVGQN